MNKILMYHFESLRVNGLAGYRVTVLARKKLR